MKKWIKGETPVFMDVLGAAVLAVWGCLYLDFAYAARFAFKISVKPLLLLFAVLFCILFLLLRKWKKSRYVLLPLTAASCLIFACFGVAQLVYKFGYRDSAQYASIDEGKSAVFANQNVLIIVPHEDDDLNLAEGIIPQFEKYGSKVTLVFATNGDAGGEEWGRTRIQEAINVAEDLGLEESDVVFLGYGDQWKNGHIYNNAESGDEIMESLAGKTQTYALENHPPYREHDYSYNNYLSDYVSLIEEIKPTMILATDLDIHPDHRAVSLIVDRAIGVVLKNNPDYHPVVLKGLAYDTAWTAPKDYYEKSGNVISSVNPESVGSSLHNPIYLWENRVRLPVAEKTLGTLLAASETYQASKGYVSQKSEYMMESVINSDEVFWQRNTDSLSYQADWSVSSGNGEVLYDFQYLDSSDVTQEGYSADAGVWIPDKDDSERRITVNLGKSVYIDHLSFFDNPSEEDNVLGVKVEFPDGTSITVSDFNLTGAETEVPIGKETDSFNVTLLESEGEYAGFTEIEIYSSESQSKVSLLKIMDEEGNFIYTCHMSGEEQTFRVYSNGAAPLASEENLILELDNPKCQAEWNPDGTISVCVPKGEETLLTLSSSDGMYSDTVLLKNQKQLLLPLVQKYEALLLRPSVFQYTFLYNALLRLSLL